MKSKDMAIKSAKDNLKTDPKGLFKEYGEDIKYMNPDYPTISLRGGDYTAEARNMAIGEFEKLGWKCEYTGYWLRLY